jgi:hypothetical protein
MIGPIFGSVNCSTEADGARALRGSLFCWDLGARAKRNIEIDI